MSYLLTCPNCGVREVTDFGYGGEVAAAPEVAADLARAQHLQLLPPQRRGRAARVVVPPLGLPRVVPRRARHAHERGALDGAARRRPAAEQPSRRSRPGTRRGGDARMTRLPQQPGERIDALAHRHVHLRRQARRGLRGRHDRLGALRVRPADVLALVQVPPPARRDVRAAASARTRSSPSTGARACAPAPSRCATGMARRAPERVAVARLRRDAGDRPRRRPVHAARLLLQDLHPPAAAVAALREGPAPRRRPRASCRKQQDEREWRTEYRRRHCDVLVIGGGIAGLAAALARRRARAPTSCSATRTSSRAARCSHEGGHERARALAEQARVAGVEILTRAPALGFFDGLVPVWQGDTLHQVRAARARRRDRRDRAAARLRRQRPARRHARRRRAPAGRALRASRPGSAAVVATTGDRGLDAALALREAGVEIARRRRPADRTPAATRPARAAGSSASRSCDGRDRRPRDRPQGASPASSLAPGRRRRARRRGTRRASSTATCSRVSGGTVAGDVAAAPGAARRRATTRRPRRFMADALPDGVLAAGAVAGHEDADAAELSGAIAGAEAAQALGSAARRRRRRELDERARAPRRAARAVAGRRAARATRATARRGGKAFVDLDEDVTVKDIELVDRRGLRLDRALQALHDRDDGPVAGPLLPAARRSA